jgi:hypothetical protein
LNNLAVYLKERFEQSTAIEDLNRAIGVIGEAVAIASPDHPDRVGYLRNLTSLLYLRCKRTGTMRDVNYATEIVGTTPDLDVLTTFGRLLADRFEKLGI